MSNNKHATILMIIPHYGHGGAQRVFAQLSNYFAKHYQVIEISFDNNFPVVYPSAGNKVCLSVEGGSNIIVKAYRFIQRCVRLSVLRIRYKPLVTISHLEGANFVNAFSVGFGKKICCVHGSKTAFDANRRGLIKFIENKIFTPLLYNLSGKIVCVSEGIRNELIQQFTINPKRLIVIPNGINYKDIAEKSAQPIPSVFQQAFNRKVVVFCGRLVAQKNPLALLDVVEKSLRTGSFNLLIIGDGPLREDMMQRCETYGLKYYSSDRPIQPDAETSIYFAGFQDNPFAFMGKASLFVLTSDFEGYPLIVCEALACGLPVMTTDCPTGVREILSTEVSGKATLHNAEFAEYGILMPLLNEQQDKFSTAKSLWSQTLDQTVKNDTLLHTYRQKVVIRARMLDEEFFFQKWHNLLKRL